MFPDGIRPRLGDQRRFFHKKILSGIGKVAGLAGGFGLPIPGVGLVAGLATKLAGGQRAAQRLCPPGQRLTSGGNCIRDVSLARTSSLVQKEAGKDAKFGGAGAEAGPQTCFLPFRWSRIQQKCALFLGEDVGPNGNGVTGPGAVPLGEVVMGIYGAGVRPGSQMIDRAVCGRKMQLGDDGVCYNKSQISNKQRMWPAGRRPLLSGGDMSAISTAARAGKRLDLATKRLQKMGMMKKPTPRRTTRADVRHFEQASAHAASRH